MQTFKDLYEKILEESAENPIDKELGRNWHKEFEKSQLNCLFNPKNNPVDWSLEEKLKQREALGKEPLSKDAMAVLECLHNEPEKLSYALVAPAFLGQLSKKATPGMLRNAFKKMGFDGMIEVAVFADILTLKEALEFDENIKTEKDYQLTSCCCPMWIAMIRKVYSDLMPHVPATVSPMIAAGRTVKMLHENSMTVFVGPCVAKKAEAKEPGLVGAIDYVLTFQEMKEVFETMQLDLSSMPESRKEFSSKAGRIYAKAGGVSEAVKNTVERLNPNRRIKVRTKMANGVVECKEMLQELMEDRATANFFEGMGCVGGCVGGPKAVIDKEIAKDYVEQYGDIAMYKTPIDNPYVIELLHRLGFDTPESLIADNEVFTRKF